MIKNLSQFKKVCMVGTKVEVVLNAIKPELQGTKREIIKAQTNALQMLLEDGRKSWLDIPKASECIIKNDTVFFTEKVVYKSNEEHIQKLNDILKSNEYDEDYKQIVKKSLDREYQNIENKKAELIRNGAEFLDENTYIWFGIKIA